jgi:purine-binding chemotaxis protein CheW
MASEHASPVPPDVPEAPRAETVPYLGFVVGSELYGLPLSRLREVARLTRLRRIPGTPSRLAGVVNVRGELVCALDAHIILERSEEERAESGYLVALRGFDYPVGLVVDTIADILSTRCRRRGLRGGAPASLVRRAFGWGSSPFSTSIAW